MIGTPKHPKLKCKTCVFFGKLKSDYGHYNISNMSLFSICAKSRAWVSMQKNACGMYQAKKAA
jgi:hypothetical protein